jgi:hypothetical protein
MHKDIQENDTQQKYIQENDTQHRDITENDIRKTISKKIFRRMTRNILLKYI